MSHVFESKITALEGECERLRAANAQLTEEKRKLLSHIEAIEQSDKDGWRGRTNLEARVKRYREALEKIKSVRDVWDEDTKTMVATEALAEPKADSEGE